MLIVSKAWMAITDMGLKTHRLLVPLVLLLAAVRSVPRKPYSLPFANGLAVSSSSSSSSPPDPGPPNIVMILADDMGWNDVSYHGSDQIPTPNIDALAYNGVILNSHYVSAMCTPSRSALLTGKYPIHTGMQHLVILEAEPRGLPLHEKLLPQYLKEAGYSTHAIGKWHQGFHRREYTPTYRGFDTHFGYWNGYQDYYDHEVVSSVGGEPYRGYDMRRNMSVAHDARGKYSTDLFTAEAVKLIDEHDAAGGPMFLYLAHLAPHSGTDREPLQAPDDVVARFSYIRDPERRIYAAMMAKLDESVGEVVAALRRNSMLQNSVVVFMADNGAATQGIHYNRGSNYPLRGIKASAWEGAVRGAAAVWSPLIRRPKRVSNDLMYIADWLPTLLSAAGLRSNVPPGKIDGVNMWPAITGESPAAGNARAEVLVNIDPIFNYSAIRRGDFKYILGTVGNGEDWYGETGRTEDAEQEGRSPAYDPETVLMSKAGTAISGLLTAKQVTEIRAVRSHTYERVREDAITTAKLLTADELLKLRSTASIRCTVPESDRIACNPRQAPCLFNIKEDPCEQRNLADQRPMILATLEEALLKYRVTAVPPSNVPNDPRADPALWNSTWVNWLDDDPLEFLVDDVSKDKIDDPGARLPGSMIALIAVLLGLALVAILALIGIRCSKRYDHALKKKQQQQPGYRNSKHFQEVVQQPGEMTAVLDQAHHHEEGNHAGAKVLDAREIMPSLKSLARSVE
ncbi:arylsulfatase I-like [Copidosoma floridanum]|uniref:arylsulfatase I-like n=1 Tax=Copidosoma floridanum TaxID=29053 RepID=UPI0006C9D5FA|nr:arylsulfatase I-like [Copidosoma floridanum]